MKNLQHKNLSELFDFGIDLEINERLAFLKKVKIFSPNKADELETMFNVDPSEFGIGEAIKNIETPCHDKLMNEAIPNKIDKYTILKVLGIGGMGIVYLGRRTDIKKLVAVKVANSLLPQGTRTEAITHEAKILANLQHPNISSLIDWGTYVNGRHFVATEYVDGMSINAYCKKNKFNITERINLFLEVVGAVEYAHNNLIIHRDIKPNNILVEKLGVVKLIDFGVAKLMKTETDQCQQTIGSGLTPSYASPEQLKGEPLSTSSDIYSLGAVLFHLLTGEQIKIETKQDYSVTNIEDILKESHETKEIWHKVGRQTFLDIKLVLNKALSSDTKQRYQSAYAFKEDLLAIINIKPIKARRPSKLYFFKKFVARNKTMSVMLFVAMLSTVIATSLAVWHWHKTVKQKNEILASNKQLKTYSKFLNTIFKGMDSYSGGNPNITMEQFLNRATKLYQQEQEVSHEQLAWFAVIVSSIYESWGLYNKALDMIEDGLKHAEQSTTPHDNVSLFTEKALLYGNDMNYQAGIKASLTALALIKQSPETEFRSPYARLALAFSYRNSGKLKKSLEVTQQIISDPKRLKREVAFAAYAHAKVQAMLYQLDRATENVNLALPIYLNRYGKDSAQVADSHALLFRLKVIKNSSGNLAMMQKEQSNLVEQFNQVYSENHSSIAQLYEIFAQAYFLTNDLTSAIFQQKKALAIFHLNTDVTVTDISHSYLRLAKYQILSGDAQNAINSIATIDHSNFDSLPNHLLAEYYLIKTSGLIATENVTSAKQALSLANQYLIDSEFKDLLAEYHFRIAQIAALESNWRLCSENAEKATQIAENLYPKTWVLSDIYRYLADKCLQQTSITNPENLFPYLDKLKISPWAQEIKITTQIKLLK